MYWLPSLCHFRLILLTRCCLTIWVKCLPDDDVGIVFLCSRLWLLVRGTHALHAEPIVCLNCVCVCRMMGWCNNFSLRLPYSTLLFFLCLIWLFKVFINIHQNYPPLFSLLPILWRISQILYFNFMGHDSLQSVFSWG